MNWMRRHPKIGAALVVLPALIVAAAVSIVAAPQNVNPQFQIDPKGKLTTSGLYRLALLETDRVEIGEQHLTFGELNRLVRERVRILKALEAAAEFVRPQEVWPQVMWDDGVLRTSTEAGRLRMQADALQARADRLERQDAAAALIREVLAALKSKGPGQ
jgi:hypothetical protein